jgi:ketol-acid reductoisomerase
MKSLLQDVRSGKFAEKWSLNPDRSKKELEDLIKKNARPSDRESWQRLQKDVRTGIAGSNCRLVSHNY